MAFIPKPKPRSTAESLQIDSQDKVVSIAKMALEGYIGSFLSTGGKNRQFTSSISKEILQFVTDKSLQGSEDKTHRPTQLARFYNDLKGKLPCILIADSAVSWEEPGLGGGFERSSVQNGKIQRWYRVCAKVNCVVSFVNNDLETCSLMQNVLAICFKQLRKEAGGTSMQSSTPGSAWCCWLPLNFTSSPSSPTDVSNDPKDKIWVSSLDLEINVETLFATEEANFTYQFDGVGVDNGDLASGYQPMIQAPSTVSLSDGPFSIQVLALNPDSQFVAVDDPRQAYYDVNSNVIVPIRTGSFNIVVYDRTKNPTTPPVKWVPKIVTTHSVSVTL